MGHRFHMQVVASMHFPAILLHSIICIELEPYVANGKTFPENFVFGSNQNQLIYIVIIGVAIVRAQHNDPYYVHELKLSSN